MFEHERLAENLKDCNHKWVLTYDNSPYIKELYSFANIFSWNITYGMQNNTTQFKQELLISNYLTELPNELGLF